MNPLNPLPGLIHIESPDHLVVNFNSVTWCTKNSVHQSRTLCSHHGTLSQSLILVPLTHQVRGGTEVSTCHSTPCLCNINCWRMWVVMRVCFWLVWEGQRITRTHDSRTGWRFFRRRSCRGRRILEFKERSKQNVRKAGLKAEGFIDSVVCEPEPEVLQRCFFSELSRMDDNMGLGPGRAH